MKKNKKHKKTAINCMVHIGADEQAVQRIEKAIIEILKAGYNYHTDRETMKEALATLKPAISVSGTTIANCNFQG